MRQPSNAIAVAVLAAVSFIFFGRYLQGGQTLAYDDLAFWFFPWKSLLYRMAQDGHISFWLPWEFCGMPHLADIQRQIFYPPNVLFYLIPTATAMVLFVALHFAIATSFMYLWLRHMRPLDPIEPAAALCGALVYGFAAFPVLHLTQLPMLGTYVWIPGLMLSLERYWQDSLQRGRPARAWLVGGGIFFCLMLLGGAPQMVFIGSALAAAYLLFLIACSRAEVGLGNTLRVALAGLIVPLFGLGLSGLQLMPMIELTAYTTRQPAVSSAYSSIGTAPTAMLWTFLNPYVFGNPAVPDSWTGGYTFHEECFYVGLVALLLCAAALGDVQRGGRRVGFFLICALLGVLIALGNNVSLGPIGLHDLMRTLVPGFGKFRVPPRWMVLTVVGVAVLVAFGVQALARYRSPRDRSSAVGAAPLALCFAAFFALGWGVLRAKQLQGLSLEQARWSFGLLFSGLAVSAMCRLPSWGSLAAYALVLLLGADLLVFAGQYVRAEPSPARSPDLDVVRSLAARGDVGRVLTHTEVEIPTQVATWCAPLGVRNVQGTNPLFLRAFIEYLYYSQAGQAPSKTDPGFMHHNGFFVMRPVESPMTRMLNLTDILELGGLPEGQTWPLEGRREPLWDRRAGRALGVAWAVPGGRVVRDQADLLATMYDDGWDPRSEALFDDVPDIALPPPSGRVKADVTVTRYADDALTVDASVDRECLLVFSEIWYPGWEATVDGAPAPVLRANSVLRAVPVKAGRHTVAMRYRPRSFLIGLTVTMATAFIMALVMVAEARRLRKR